jgi:hypothetical protein
MPAASSTKEAVLRAAQLTTLLLDEVSPGEACEEIFAYCEAKEALIEAEANEERQRLNLANVNVEARISA